MTQTNGTETSTTSKVDSNKRAITKRNIHIRSRKIAAVVCCAVMSISTLAGCTSSQTTSDTTKKNTKVQVSYNGCNTSSNVNALSASAAIFDPENYSSREEYFNATGPYVVQMCNATNFKYPSILYAQLFWESGLSYDSAGNCHLSNIAKTNHAFFGIKAGGSDPDDCPFWDAGEGLEHADGGNARAYSSYQNSIYDYIDWLARNGINATVGDTSYSCYAAGANAASSGKDGLSNICNMGYSASDYSSKAFNTLDNITKFDSQVSISGEPKPLSEVNISSNTMKNSSSSVSQSTGTLVGSSVAEQVWNYFKADGFTDEATAGIMGNLDWESGMDPTKIQGNGEGPAAGIAQWEDYNTKDKRWKNLNTYAQSKGKDWTDLQTQLEFLLNADGELGDSLIGYSQDNCGKAYTLDDYKKITDIDEAVEVFEKCFERSGNPALEPRKSAAREYYEQFKGTAATSDTEVSEACEDDDGNQRFGNAGIDEGEKYAQIQGTHYDNGVETSNTDSGAAQAACGATAFTVGVNMLLGQVHKYCAVEVWKSMNSYSEAIGWGANTDAADWLNANNLNTTLMVTGINDVQNRQQLLEKLQDGNVVVASSAGWVFKESNGNNYYSGGHYILFYKYENGKFYVDDSGHRSAGGGVEYSEQDVDDFFNSSDRNGGGSCSIKRC